MLIPISVILPIKNGEIYIPRIRDSISKNINSLDEVVIVNDGSTDQTRNLLSNWEKADGRVKIINTQGIGLVAALNLAISNSRHDWLARFDVDDEYAENRLYLQRREIDENTGAIFSDYQIISESGHNLGTFFSPVVPSATVISLVSGNRTAHPSVLMKKSVIQAAGCYKQDEYPAEDLGLWIRISEIAILKSIPVTLLYYHLSPLSITATNRGRMLGIRDSLQNNLDFLNRATLLCLREYKEILNCYKVISNGLAREILFTIDLFKLFSKVNYKLKFRLLKILITQFGRLCFNKNSVMLILKMKQEQKNRQKYRKSQK